ncbi:histidine kinase [Reichenbachiella sp.]|uniref:sensor histidine kinase n=1 Tax=Reichenbachiella sp. TaxID=2184521 RepID=UPI00329690E3
MISRKERSKLLVSRYAYWVFAIGVGMMLLLLEEADIEPFFSITSFFYWSLLAYWAVRWTFRQIRSTLRQKREKTNVELLHLQSQVNPHFFFNTLNNLYGLIEKDSKKAKDMVLKLSDMMRYSIYEGQKDWVILEDELEYIRNYIELHKVRYHKETDIKLNLHIQQEGIRVMPLLFIILLENAFKHGVENLRKEAYVHINLIASETEINFAIENNFDINEQSEEPGIGLQNLERRLELVYPKRHTFSHTATNNIYKAQLTLKSK